MLIIRNLQNQILQLNNEVKAFFLKGVNQSGKTTLLKNLASPDRKYADLAEPALRSLANEEPVLFLQRYAPPVLIDNIQYAPELVPVIKDYVLKHGKPGDFWLIVPKEDAETITAIMHELGDKFACLELCGLSSAELDGRESTPFIPDMQLLAGRMQNPVPHSVWRFTNAFGAAASLQCITKALTGRLIMPNWCRIFCSVTSASLFSLTMR